MTINDLTPFTGTKPNKNTQTIDDFDINVQDWVDYTTELPDKINDFIDELAIEVSNITTQAGVATTQAGVATTQAGLATTNGSVQVALAEEQASLAAEQANIAMAASNYAGFWSSLTGELLFPVSVYHDENYWALSENIADVTLEEPGVSSKWTAIGAGDVFLDKSQTITNKTLGAGTKFPWSVKTANYAAIAGDNIACNTTASAFTITLPATPYANDMVSISDYAGTFEDFNLTIDRNGSKIVGIDENFICDMKNLSFTLVYTDTTQGWRIV